MIDIRLLRSDPDAVRAGIARRGEDTSSLDRVVELDARLRGLAEERDRPGQWTVLGQRLLASAEVRDID